MKSQISINRWVYSAFVLLGIYMVVFHREYANAATYIGVALAFDPFDVNQPWNERPTWQKAILIAHLAFTAALIGYEIGFNDRG